METEPFQPCLSTQENFFSAHKSFCFKTLNIIHIGTFCYKLKATDSNQSALITTIEIS